MTTHDEVLAAMCGAAADYNGLCHLSDRRAATIYADQVARMLTAAEALGWKLVPAPEYLIWSNEHAAWWRPNGCGYTRDMAAAGRYARDEAIAVSLGRDGWEPGQNPPEIPVLIEDAAMLAAAAEVGR